ncbi:MAG: hypothetical protein R3C01_07870 [Planctomycetaceae bacterium]
MAPANNEEKSEASLIAIQVFVFLLVNFVLWGFAAGFYNGGSGVGSSRRARGNLIIFIVSSLSTLPEIGSVIPYIWNNHFWFVLVFFVVETLLVLFLIWMKKVDNDLKSGNPFRRR